MLPQGDSKMTPVCFAGRRNRRKAPRPPNFSKSALFLLINAEKMDFVNFEGVGMRGRIWQLLFSVLLFIGVLVFLSIVAALDFHCFFSVFCSVYRGFKGLHLSPRKNGLDPSCQGVPPCVAKTCAVRPECNKCRDFSAIAIALFLRG